MNRKAQGISVNVIIIAAIALVVMVLLIALVLNAGGDINRGVSSCEAQDEYTCVFPGESCGDGYIQDITRSCDGDANGGQTKCCIPL